MIYVEAKITLFSISAVGGSFIESGLRTTLKICSNGYICKITTLNNSAIFFNVETVVDIDILYGEADLINIARNCEFELVSGKIIGKGVITKIKHIIIEKETLVSLNDLKLSKEIVKYAELLQVAEIEDGVYKYLNGNE